MSCPFFTIVPSSTYRAETRPPMRGEMFACRCGTTYPVATSSCCACAGLTSETAVVSTSGTKIRGASTFHAASRRTAVRTTPMTAGAQGGNDRRRSSRSMRRLFSSSASDGGVGTAGL